MTFEIPVIVELIVLGLFTIIVVWHVLDIIYSGIAYWIAKHRLKQQDDKYKQLGFYEEGFGDEISGGDSTSTD